MRLTLLIIFGFLFIAGSGFYVLMRTIRDDVERQYSQAAEEPLVDVAIILASLVEQDLSEARIDPGKFRAAFTSAYGRKFRARIYQLEKTELNTHVYVTDRTGEVLFDSDGGRREGEDFSDQNDVYLTLRGEYGVRATRIDPEDSRSSVFHVAAPIRWDGEIIGVLTVMRPEAAMAPFADETREQILRTSLIAGALVALLGAVWTYWLVSPVGQLTDRARRVKRGERTRVPELGCAELRSLSRALEEMRRELEGRHYVENYVQALTHEMKSPLAAIRGAAELLEDPEMAPDRRERFLGNILAETERSEDLVRRLLQLATIESQSELERREPCDFGALVADEIEKLASLSANQRLEVATEDVEPERYEIQGDPLMLAIAVRNLLTNAFDFAPVGSEVRVTIRETPERKVELRVEDEGPGLPDYAGERVFERFYSLKHSVTGRKGSGLGLCFVRETALLHGGEVSLENRGGDQSGALARLALPLQGASTSSSSPS